MPPDPRGVQVVGSGWLQRTSRPGLPGRGRAWRPIVADRHDIDQRPGSVINAGRAPLGTAPEAGDATWARARVSWLHCRSYSYSLYCCRTTPSEEKQTGLRGGNMRALVTATVRLLRASAGGGRSRPLLSLLPNFSSELTLGVAVVICRTRYRTMYRAKAKNPKKPIVLLVKRGDSDPQIIEELYLAAFSRYPTVEERAELEGLVRRQTSRTAALEDLTWGIITSREFASNH